jgi:hypothetical protein
LRFFSVILSSVIKTPDRMLRFRECTLKTE